MVWDQLVREVIYPSVVLAWGSGAFLSYFYCGDYWRILECSSCPVGLILSLANPNLKSTWFRQQVSSKEYLRINDVSDLLVATISYPRRIELDLSGTPSTEFKGDQHWSLSRCIFLPERSTCPFVSYSREQELYLFKCLRACLFSSNLTAWWLNVRHAAVHHSSGDSIEFSRILFTIQGPYLMNEWIRFK